ncbi:MAG: HDIG domain-containing protein [Ignavibacteriales bacterium]|nr:HDIG domain-containing protein [Ignavibacteriales bacterium]
MNRTDALALLCQYTKSDSLQKHGLAVECAMRAYAGKYSQDEELWGMTGLLHDFDYEMYPTIPDHPLKGSEILQQQGYPEEMRIAILGHASYTLVPRESLLAKALYACDELSGFITACTLVRPSKKIAELEVSSVRKKMKDKGFARTVDRVAIVEGAEELGIPLDEHIQFVIDALKRNAATLGL